MTWQYYFNQYGNQWMMPFRGLSDGLFGFFILSFLVMLAWSLVWKGIALWKAARKGDKFWFVFLLLVNTVGIFEILYIYIFSEGRGIVVADKDLEDLKKEMKEIGVRKT